MASTTNAKKEIIDYLWEWTDPKGDWAKLLVDTVVKTEDSLSSPQRQLIFDHFIDSLRTTKKLPPLIISKPKFLSTFKDIKLKSLSQITGVNRLAKNQKMEFSNNITVIYGENGTGKTGYGRILKSMGFSYDKHKTIHGNIYSAYEPKSAVIDFSSSGTAKSFLWDGQNIDDDLSNVSIFNNNCVQLSLSDRRLIVSPIGFHLFGIVTSELAELSNMLASKKATYSEILPFYALLHDSTPQTNFINILSYKTTDAEIQAVSAYSGDINEDIKLKKSQLSELNESLIISQIKELQNQIKDIELVEGKIKIESIKIEDVNTLKLINDTINGLQSRTTIGLKGIAEANGIEFYDSKEFKLFLQSAEEYIELLKSPYPVDGDTCIYCKQTLSKTAKSLLSSYQTLLADQTESDLKQQVARKELLLANFKQRGLKYTLLHSAFGLDKDGNPIQPQELTDLHPKLENLRQAFLNDTITNSMVMDVNYDEVLKVLIDKRKEIQDKLNVKNDLLTTITSRGAAITKEINELQDRKLIADNLSVIKQVIVNKKNINLLNSKAGEFNSNAISRKTTEARDALISHNFNSMFQNELKAFRKSHIQVDLSFGTDRGHSKVSQTINKYILSEILSEGEQKAIALAEFLAELQLDGNTAPVIFDDPVNSLDHTIIEEVSKRLIQLSKTRQVIIFTHSILLLNSFIQQSELDPIKKYPIDFRFYSVKNNFGETGILDDVEEINSVTYYTKKLKAIVECVDKTLDESRLAAEGYGHLRSVIEVCVEEDILKKTIKRYRKGVAFPSLLRIDGNKLETHKIELNDIYEKCCTLLIGHSNPTDIHITPTLAELRIDFDNFTKLRKQFL